MSGAGELVAEARALPHYQYGGETGYWCACGQPFPCVTARLAEALERAETTIEHIAYLERVRDTRLYKAEVCRIVSAALGLAWEGESDG